MKKLLFILLAFAPALLFAGELKVSVVDKELEIPLEGVKLSVKANPSASAQTDENGTAVIVIPDNLSSGTVEGIDCQSYLWSFVCGQRICLALLRFDTRKSIFGYFRYD